MVETGEIDEDSEFLICRVGRVVIALAESRAILF
jgi:hypothetical protein